MSRERGDKRLNCTLTFDGKVLTKRRVIEHRTPFTGLCVEPGFGRERPTPQQQLKWRYQKMQNLMTLMTHLKQSQICHCLSYKNRHL